MFLLRGVTGSQWQAALTHVGLRAESRQTTGAGWTSGTARDELTVTEVRGRAVLRPDCGGVAGGLRRCDEQEPKSGGAVVSPMHYGPLMGCWPWAGECSTLL